MEHPQSEARQTDNKLPTELMEGIVASGPGLVAIIEPVSFKIIFCNDQFENCLGYSQDDVSAQGFSFLDILQSYQQAQLATQLDIVTGNAATRAKYVVYKLRKKTGELQWFYLYASPVKKMGEHEGSYYYLLMHPDLSSWNLPFISFDTRELFLEQFDNEPFGTFEWIIEQDKVFWSDGVYRIYEVDKSNIEIDNNFARSFIHPDERERVTAEMEDAFSQNRNVNIEYKMITGAKNIKLIHSLGKVIRDADGKAVKFVGSVRDITELRSREDDLRKKVEELNRSNKELEEFAYVASHDMQEPLRKITTFSGRLEEKYKDALTGDGAMYLERMVASAENMRLLINNLLEFSRISKSTQPFSSVNLNFVLHQVKNDLELIIEETGTTVISPILPVVDGLMSQMKQLFMNLISNAIKFHKQYTRPAITIETNVIDDAERAQYELPEGTTYHKIQFTDNGIGFEREYATRIFQIFQRLHGKSEYPGSGIGLAICKKIVEHHHGIIYADNIPDVGARFTFILPEKQVKK